MGADNEEGMRPTVIFDTSALNGLANEPEAAAIATCLGKRAFLRLTETDLSEIAATTKPEARKKLVETCQRLIGNAECIGPHHWIIEEQVKRHVRRPNNFYWQGVDVRVPALEAEVVNPRFLNDDTVAVESRELSFGTEKQFKQMFREARERFPIPPDERIQITLQDVVELALKDGAHWRMAADIYERYSGTRLSEPEIRNFVNDCPPFNAMMLSTCVAHFHGSVRDHRLPATYDAGRIDLMCSVYLPYCDSFVTRDDGQFNSLTEIAKLSGLSTRVMYYKDFRDSSPIND